MKKIGILGGMSWESSLVYYKTMNQEIKNILGNTHSANCIMYSFDFHEIEYLQHKGNWKALTDLMIQESQNLKNAGAEFIVIATNTMHIMAPDIEKKTNLKVLHIADVTADEIINRNLKKVLLLGTKFTMESNFYKSRFEYRNIEVVIPNENERQIIHDIIYNQLILGDINQKSKSIYIDIIEKYAKLGIEGVVLGCTEIPLLIQQNDVSINVLDTTLIHSKAAISFSLK